MPTDDDYGRRECLLLHQHPTSQYGQQSTTVSSLPLSSTISSSSTSLSIPTQQVGPSSGISATDCYHKQQQQSTQRSSTSSSSSSTPAASSNVVSASHQDRYQINDKLQTSEVPSEYGSSSSSRVLHERYERPSESQQHYKNKAEASRTTQSSIDNARYVIESCQDQRIGQTSASSQIGLQIGHHAYGSTSIALGRSSNSSSCQATSTVGSSGNVHIDRYIRYTEATSLSGDQKLSLQPIDRFQPTIVNENAEHGTYNNVKTTGSSMPSGDGAAKAGASEYANSSIITGIVGGSSVLGGSTPSANAFSPDTFPSPPSPAPASDRFVPPPPLSPSPSEKYTSSQSLNAVCYTGSSCDRILPPGSPGNRDRCYVTAPASPMSKDVRYSAMSSDRNNLVIDRIQASLHEAKEHQEQQQQQQQQHRYAAGPTETLLSSASPVLGAGKSRDSENSRCGGFQVAAGHKDSSGVGMPSRYFISSDRLPSSSPINASERFATGAKTAERYHGSDSPSHENQTRYHHHQQQHHRQELASTGLHPECYSSVSSSERYLSSSPNPETPHGRYSAERSHLNSTGGDRESRRYSTSERSLEGICQKYSERKESRGCSNSGSPANTDEYICGRFSSFQEVTMQPRYPLDQRFVDIGGIQRYVTSQSSNSNAVRHEQTRASDRYVGSASNDRYLSTASPGHDSRLGVNSDGVRYGNCPSSTERLLASSAASSSATDSARYHQALYSGGTTNCGQTKSNRYGPLSPTPENNQSNLRGYSQQCTSAKSSGANPTSSDKYIQVSKSLQVSYGNAERYHQVGQVEQFERSGPERGYPVDRYGHPSNSGNTDQRYQVAGSNGAFHSVNTDRFSPSRVGHPDKYLSLPKPKDNFVTGRIVTSCSTLGVGGPASSSVSGPERSYSSTATATYVPPNAHTPVERYVPQPPPEVLYPERYADRYVSPAAHTPTDRYVPTADPGDPYMRRDLGFHHHYRLPQPGYPYHQTHFRFRSFAYASPGRHGGSPGSSSSSSSTSVQRELSTSPLLRSKVRNSAIEIGNSGRQVNPTGQATCCSDPTRNCCPPVRRSLPPGALPSIPNQSAHSSWQPSPSSGTTGTSTVSSSGTDGESTQSIGIYGVVGDVGKSEKSTATTDPSSSPLVGPSNIGDGIVTSGPNITRSVSAPAGPRPVVQQSISSTSAATSQRPRLRRNMSRTEALRNYIKRETATFFGVDEESEVLEKQRWLDRRRRMASRKYGALLPEYKPPDPDITRDVPDSTEIPEGVTLRRWQQPVRRKDSVARMTLSGLHYMVETLTKQRPRERSVASRESRSFPPSVISSISQTEVATPANESAAAVVEVDEEDEAFFLRPILPSIPPPAPPPPPAAAAAAAPTAIASQQIQDDKIQAPEAQTKENTSTAVISNDPSLDIDRDFVEELVRFTPHKEERSSVDGYQVRRPRAITRDHYTSRKTSWRRSRQHDGRSICDPATGSQQEAAADVILRRELSGGTRISPSTIDRVFDNSNRRQYGMGIVGRLFGRSFRKSVAHKPDVRKQLDDIEDHRPFFTYWITTVQVFILIISLACYGFGPVGIDLNRRSGLVLVTSLSLQQVDYDEPANFWLGPRAADLIHLGAKFAPCMRRDFKILNEIDVWRERERDTACCIRNDDSGCVQSSKADCSNTISTWKKWVPGDSGPGGRISGSVCGLDPKFCDAPASVAPYEWPDDITKWPICRKTNPFSQRFRSNNGNHQQNSNNFPIGRYKDKMAEHMVCEVIGHPCCIGIHGMCRITTKEYCDFVHGYFHEEASLCSQVECLHDVCGMIPFLHPEWPDQFYRLFTTTFLHAGILHLAITLLVQYFLMRDLEKLTGSLRIALIYFVGALAGNLASAIFIPHRAEVGPAGAHFALLATLVVEVLNCWPMLKHPRRALTKLVSILGGLLLLGVLPWVDNYAHLFGFIFGFLAAYALMPFISFGKYDRRRKILLIWICLVLIIGLFALLLTLFYNVPFYECEICKLFNCIPFTRDFCASQNINFKKEEPV